MKPSPIMNVMSRTQLLKLGGACITETTSSPIDLRI